MPLTGTVYDVTGAVLPGVVDDDGRRGRAIALTATTDRNGRFDFGVGGARPLPVSIERCPASCRWRRTCGWKSARQWDCRPDLPGRHAPGDDHRHGAAARGCARPAPIASRCALAATSSRRASWWTSGRSIRRRCATPASRASCSLTALIDVEGRVASVRVDRLAGASRPGQGGRRRRAPVAVHADAAQRRQGRSADDRGGRVQPAGLIRAARTSAPRACPSATACSQRSAAGAAAFGGVRIRLS